MRRLWPGDGTGPRHVAFTPWESRGPSVRNAFGQLQNQIVLLFKIPFSLESTLTPEQVRETLRRVIRTPRWILLQKRPSTRYRGWVQDTGFQLTTDDRAWRLEARLGPHRNGTTIAGVVGIPIFHIVPPLVAALMLVTLVLVLNPRRLAAWEFAGVFALVAALPFAAHPRRCRRERDWALAFLSDILVPPAALTKSHSAG
jgi:hypothetical protein